MMLTVLIDSNITDKFLSNPSSINKVLALKNSKVLRIIHTSIQRYENEAAPEAKALELRNIRETISEEVLPFQSFNSGGHSSKMRFRLSSSLMTKQGLGIENKKNPEGIATSIDDAATFRTAKHENAVFVSEDANARSRASSYGVDSWNFAELISRLEDL